MHPRTREILRKHIQKISGLPYISADSVFSEVSTKFYSVRPFEEFVVEVPEFVLAGLSRTAELKAFVDLLLRRWLDVQPEIFVDVATSRIGIRIPYHVQAIEEIKAFIPAGARTWDGNTKTWYVNMSYVDNVERIIKKHFPNVKVTTVEASLPAPVDGDEFGALLRPLPDVALKAVYRAIAITCHPDRAVANGLTNDQATTIMKDVNVAWTRIKKARGWE